MIERKPKNLKSRIMFRIFCSWLMRSVIPLFLLELIALGMAIYFFANLIFVGAVMDNALSAALGNPLNFISYMWGAFFATRLEVQAVVVILFLGALMLLRDINRGIVCYLIMRKDRVLGK